MGSPLRASWLLFSRASFPVLSALVSVRHRVHNNNNAVVLCSASEKSAFGISGFAPPGPHTPLRSTRRSVYSWVPVPPCVISFCRHLNNRARHPTSNEPSSRLFQATTTTCLLRFAAGAVDLVVRSWRGKSEMTNGACGLRSGLSVGVSLFGC